MLPTTTPGPDGVILKADRNGTDPHDVLSSRAAEAMPLLEVGPGQGLNWFDLREVWRHRELLYFLTWRDVKVRYKQTVLGVAWAVVQPLFTMVVFTILFSVLAGMPSDGIAYPVFSFTALLPWTYFAGVLGNASNSLVNNGHLVNRVYFPRLLIPMSAVFTGLVDFAIATGTLFLLMLGYGYIPPLSALVTVPLLTLIASMLALGVSLWLSALNVRYRDVRHVVPFLLQLWMYATPIAWPLSKVKEKYPELAPLMVLNPMTGVIEGFRSALLPDRPWDWSALGVSAAAAVVMLVLGTWYFRRIEDEFADVV